MPRPKLLELTKTLLEQTRAGKLKWDVTAVPDAFRLSLPSMAAQITKSATWNSSSGEDEITYRISVLDEQGAEIDSSDWFSGEDSQILGQLYDEARAGALNIDDRLAGLIDALKGGQTKSK